MQPADRYALLASALGGRLISVAPLDGGVSADSHLLTYDVVGETRRAVVRGLNRLSYPGAPDETLPRLKRLLGSLHEAGLPVGRPLLLDDDGPTADDTQLGNSLVVGQPSAGSQAGRLVVEYISGTTELPDISIALPALAELLARVHAVPADAVESAQLPAAVDPAGEARDLLHRLRPDLDVTGIIEDPQPRPHPGAGAGGLVHGDFWPGNVLWQDGRVVGLIDWEDAGVGDPECDLGTARTELTLALDAGAAAEFRRHYDRVCGQPPDEHRVDLWTVCSAAGMLLYVGGWGLPAEREQQVRAVAREVLDETLARLASRRDRSRGR